jgi:hypothetical protein
MVVQKSHSHGCPKKSARQKDHRSNQCHLPTQSRKADFQEKEKNLMSPWEGCFREVFLMPVEGKRDRWEGKTPDWGQ